MAKFTGGLASFSFASTVYECISNYSWSGSVSEAVGRCSASGGAVTHRATGATDDTFNFDVLLEGGSITVTNALKRGESGAFEFHPEGDTAANMEFIATNAIINSSNLGGDPDSLNVLSITIGIDGDLTIQAAT